MPGLRLPLADLFAERGAGKRGSKRRKPKR
jgi:hypothetical protein